MYKLGHVGDCSPVNIFRGMELYFSAADKGCGQAFFNLGRTYEKGAPGIDKNMSTAIFYFEKSAKLGYSAAQNKLGHKYRTGNSIVCRDFDKAFSYFKSGLIDLFWGCNFVFTSSKT